MSWISSLHGESLEIKSITTKRTCCLTTQRFKKIKLATEVIVISLRNKLHTSCQHMCAIWVVNLQLSLSSLKWLSSLSVSSGSLQSLNDKCSRFPSWKPNNKSEDVTHAICIVWFVPRWGIVVLCSRDALSACSYYCLQDKNTLKARDIMEKRKRWGKEKVHFYLYLLSQNVTICIKNVPRIICNK